MLIEWSDDRPLGSAGCGSPAESQVRIRSEEIGLIEGVNGYCRTGDHRPEGLFVTLGPGIPAGRIERTVSITDFAPTFTALLGVELPGVDGRPISELLAWRNVLS